MQKDMVQRFLEYIKIDTTSDEESKTCPSTKIQFNLAELIIKDLETIGLSDISLDTNGYIMATLPSTTSKNVPTVGLIAHIDTAPSYNGENVKPQIIKSYDGKDIVLNQKNNITMSTEIFPDLKKYKGQDLIVTDGTSLLGADNKAGIVEIIEAIKFFLSNPQIEHGEIKIAFTPDEEIGRGANLFDVKKFGAKFAYTIDGGELGEIEFDNFNAASVKVKIKGCDIHPGTAKNKMVNATLIGMEFNSMLPINEKPEYTSGYEGFNLLCEMSGNVENCELNYIIRDHSKEKFESKKTLMLEIEKFLKIKYPVSEILVEIEDSYLNMKEKIEPVIEIIDIVKKSMLEVGVEPLVSPIRGGTDGARLSYMGLPCPNIFTGGHNFHGKFEYIPINSMHKAVEVIIKLIENINKDFSN